MSGREDRFRPDVVAPAIGATLPDGEMGELAFTSRTGESVSGDPRPRPRSAPPADRRGADDAANGKGDGVARGPCGSSTTGPEIGHPP